MPGETATQPLMPGGYKPEILANTGGRIGYNTGGKRTASYDYNDAMGESWNEFKRLQKKGVIPLDMEFEEFLEHSKEGGFWEAAGGGLMRTGYAMGTEHPSDSFERWKSIRYER